MFQAILCAALFTPGQAPCDAPCCSAPCATKSVCVKEPTIVKVKHVSYSVKCTEYCLPRQLLIGDLIHGGGCKACGQVRVKHELVKHVCEEEKCEMKCKPEPACCAPCK